MFFFAYLVSKSWRHFWTAPKGMVGSRPTTLLTCCEKGNMKWILNFPLAGIQICIYLKQVWSLPYSLSECQKKLTLVIFSLDHAVFPTWIFWNCFKELVAVQLACVHKYMGRAARNIVYIKLEKVSKISNFSAANSGQTWWVRKNFLLANESSIF